MFLDPRALFMLVLLVGVTGWVLKGLMVTWHRLNKADKPSTDVLNGMEDRLRNVEAATSSLLVDVTGLREKQRFMAKLQSGAEVSAPVARSAGAAESDISPLSTQNIPIIPRAGKR